MIIELIIAVFVSKFVHSQTLLTSALTSFTFSNTFTLSGTSYIQQSYQSNYILILDWYINFFNITSPGPLVNLAYTANDGKSVLGLNNFQVLTTMWYTTTVPAHYRIRIQLSFYFTGPWNDSYIGLKADNKILATFHSVRIYNGEYSNIDVSMPHLSPTLTIYISQYNNDNQMVYGIRDFYLYYYACPAGCNFCTQQGICSDWSRQLNDFTSLYIDQLTNSGWSPTGTITSYTYSKCGGLGAKTIGLGQGIYKQILLPPHFAMRFTYYAIKVDMTQSQSLYVYVDNIQYDRFTSTENPRFQRSFCGSLIEIDDYVKKDLIFLHSTQLTTIAINTTLTDSLSSFYMVRDIQLFIKKCDSSCQACTGPLAADCIENDNFLQFQATTVTDLTSNTFATHGWQYTKYPNSNTYVLAYSTTLSIIGVLTSSSKSLSLQKTFQLPTHLRIQLSATLYSGISGICSSTATGNVQFLIDNILAQSYTAASICSSPKISFSYDHTRSYVQIDVITSGYTNGINVGLREFQLFYGTCASDCSSCTDSGDCVTAWTLYDYEFFTQIFTGVNGWDKGRYTVGMVPVSICNLLSIVGQLSFTDTNSVVSKTFNFNAHKMLRITMDLYFFGGWANEYFYIYIDGQQVFQQTSNKSNQNMNLGGACGSSTAIVQVDFFISHTATTSLFELYALIDQTADSKAWGFRNLIIYQI